MGKMKEGMAKMGGGKEKFAGKGKYGERERAVVGELAVLRKRVKGKKRN